MPEESEHSVGLKNLSSIKEILLNPTVLVVALGYFVDIFDLTLFNMVRRPSLISLGIPESELVSKGLFLLNTQMIGMLVGGFIWGIMGDKKGRLSTLFGSILLYSLANIANGLTHTYELYVITRFIAGVGLAGELGLGITLVSEILPKQQRGLGTTMVASIGVLGAVLGGIFVEIFPWRVCYFIGGGFGLTLLFLRFKMKESHLFEKVKDNTDVKRGSLMTLLTSAKSLKKLFAAFLIGMPIWYVAGILMPFGTEFAKDAGLIDPIVSSRCVAIAYLGLSMGDLGSGFLSQVLASRKKSIYAFQGLAVFFLAVLAFANSSLSEYGYYVLCFLLGTAVGYWALFVTVSAENFGTNVRSTAATIMPNIVRASVFPMSLLLGAYKDFMPYWKANLAVGFTVIFLSILGTYLINETFKEDLNYFEH